MTQKRRRGTQVELRIRSLFLIQVQEYVKTVSLRGVKWAGPSTLEHWLQFIRA